MVTETEAKKIIIRDTCNRIDAMEYGKKMKGISNFYIVKGKRMTLTEYENYCIKKELKKYGIS